MSDVDTEFKAALESVKTISDPGAEVQLKLYGLYKQATIGDVSGKKPGFADMVGKAKWKAWGELKGTSQDEAKAQYVELANSLK